MEASFNFAYDSLERLDYDEIGSDLSINFLRQFVEVACRHASERFNNKRLVFQSHIQEIIGLKKVDSTSAGKLREFSGKVNSHMRALESLGSSQEISGGMVIHMLLQKLDITTQSCWEESAPMDQILALLDSGSQLHLVTSRLAEQLQLKKNRSTTIVSGLGDTNVRTEGHTVEICLKYRADSLTALVSPTITDSQHGIGIGIQNWNIPANYKPQRVDLLIGASMFLLCVGQIKLWEVGSCSVGLNSSEEKSIEEHSKQDQQLTGAAEATTADTKQATQPLESAIRWNCES
ncbi:GH22163 [Drosophila grimshawi]|uniref:GH22163 n=1 Tax=Drosophila grimshawi TaxID=7222 RepID=B4K1K1_DROGR|nr:GH22163 [Drosophila grimshawi]